MLGYCTWIFSQKILLALHFHYIFTKYFLIICKVLFVLQSNKASVAAKTVLNFNRDLKIEAYKERVSIETESIFNDQYFADLNGVINALDNVDARLFSLLPVLIFLKSMLFIAIQIRSSNLK